MLYYSKLSRRLGDLQSGPAPVLVPRHSIILVILAAPVSMAVLVAVHLMGMAMGMMMAMLMFKGMGMLVMLRVRLVVEIVTHRGLS